MLPLDEVRCELLPPSVADYCQLRVLAGLSAKAPQAASVGLSNSLHAVSLYAGERLLAMGRVIGDGGCFLQVVDIAVRPEYQGRGLGKAVMQRLDDWLVAHAQGAYVSLIADGQAHRLYAQFGFAPTAPKSIGMAKVVGQQSPAGSPLSSSGTNKKP